MHNLLFYTSLLITSNRATGFSLSTCVNAAGDNSLTQVPSESCSVGWLYSTAKRYN